jgi:Gamma-glutamyl cyclotransferase, AIG2-like
LDELFFAAFMLSRRIEVFFYGLFMDADLMRAKGADPINIRPACVPGFALRIGERATLLRNPDARAYGMLMELTHAEIEQLYSEPSVRAYRPEAVLSELADGSRIPALCFNLIVPLGPDEGNSEYAGKLRDLARRLGFPSDYVESIQ